MSRPLGAAYALREGDAKGFFRAPFEAYGPQAPYVSPMRSDLRRLLDRGRNPFFDGRGEGTHFTVYRGSTPIGRVSAHVHHEANRRFGLSRGYFGFFDVADDATAAGLLLDAAEAWLRRRGCAEVAGNFSLTSVQEIGVVTKGHGRAAYTAMHWSPPHLPGVLREAGYAPFFPMSTFELDVRGFDPASLVGPEQSEIFRSPDFAWTPLGRRSFRRRAADVRRLMNESFSGNPHYVPVSPEEFAFQAEPLMWVVDPRLSLLVDHEGRPGGVLVCIPDLNPLLRRTRSRLTWRTPLEYLRYRRDARRAVIVFGGVAPSLQNRGLGGAMLHRVVSALKAAGYTHLGITWVSTENGPSRRFMEKLGARPLHELALFRKELVP